MSWFTLICAGLKKQDKICSLWRFVIYYYCFPAGQSQECHCPVSTLTSSQSSHLTLGKKVNKYISQHTETILTGKILMLQQSNYLDCNLFSAESGHFGEGSFLFQHCTKPKSDDLSPLQHLRDECCHQLQTGPNSHLASVASSL